MDTSDDDCCSARADDVHVNIALKPASVARIVELARESCTAEQWGEWLGVPLEHAAAEGDQELTKELVLAGASGDPISAAMKGGQREIVDCLVQLDREHTTCRLQQHHLRLAVELEDEAFVTVVLTRGVKPEKDCLLRLAAALGNEALVSLLLQHGADPDDSPEHLLWEEGYSTPVLIAATRGDASILGMLLDAGAAADRRLSADQPAAEDDGSSFEEEPVVRAETESALDLAAIWGHVGVINAIVRREPSIVNSVTESTGKTALIYAAKSHEIGAVDALVQAGADLESRDRERRTALHVAAESPDCESTMRLLLKHGARVDVADGKFLTPLCLAMIRGDQVAARILIEAGADLSKSLLSLSGLHNEHSSGMIRALLSCGADINTRRAVNRNSPLHLAAMKGIVGNVKILLAAGGDEHAVNGALKTPADVAGHEMSILVKMIHGADGVIKHLLKHAARDRSWDLRTLFVLCRKFPDRLCLRLPSSKVASDEDRSPRSAACRRSVTNSHPNKKAAKPNGAGQDDPAERATFAWPSAPKQRDDKFASAMDQLIGLQAEAVFLAIISFV